MNIIPNNELHWENRHVVGEMKLSALFSVFKGLSTCALTVAGMHAIYHHLRAVYMLEPARSDHAPKWILFYVFMNALDEIKAILLKRHITDHIHHIATGVGFTIDYMYGSHRTQVLCQMGYVGEAVAPFYQVAPALGPTRWEPRPHLALLVHCCC